MAWFKRKAIHTKSTDEAHDTRVQVVVEKEAAKEVAEKAKQATKTLNELLEANHFTIKIYRAVTPTDSKQTKKVA